MNLSHHAQLIEALHHLNRTGLVQAQLDLMANTLATDTIEQRQGIAD